MAESMQFALSCYSEQILVNVSERSKICIMTGV